MKYFDDHQFPYTFGHIFMPPIHFWRGTQKKLNHFYPTVAQEFMKWLGMELYKLKWSTKEYLECQKSPKVHYFSKDFKYFQNFGSLNREATSQKSSLF